MAMKSTLTSSTRFWIVMMSDYVPSYPVELTESPEAM